jgi:hypothetical protein
MVQRVLNRISFNFCLRTLELKLRGFLFREKGSMTDFTKLNNRIVRQVWEFNNLTLNAELKTKLVQDKVRRAVEMIQAREQGPVFFKVKD